MYKILMVHNSYAALSGEEVMVDRITSLLQENGHEVKLYLKDSAVIKESPLGRLTAFCSGIYSSKSRAEIKSVLHEFQPDIVQVQNLYPLISPSILSVIHEKNIPVVMRLANYRLICPNGMLFRRGHVCLKCLGGREDLCFFLNCEQDLFKSLGYALRNWVARKRKFYLDNVSFFYAQTDFQKQLIVDEGYPESQIDVIPNMYREFENSMKSVKRSSGVLFVGRVSPEKGVDTLLEAAKLTPDITFTIAGSFQRFPQLTENAPANVRFLGHQHREDLARLYSESRLVVVPSSWYEGFPGVLIEAMMQEKPIICSDIGGLGEIVDDQVTGLLFKPGDAKGLAQLVRRLYDDEVLCKSYGRAGREKAIREYSPKLYYQRLMQIYDKARERRIEQSNHCTRE